MRKPIEAGALYFFAKTGSESTPAGKESQNNLLSRQILTARGLSRCLDLLVDACRFRVAAGQQSWRGHETLR